MTLFDPTAIYLDQSQSSDKDSAAKASRLLSAISRWEFIVAVTSGIGDNVPAFANSAKS